MNNNRIVRGLLVVLVALAVTGIAFAQYDKDDNSYNHGPALVKFKGGIGVQTVTGVAADGTVKLNVVRGVNPGAPWRIADLDAVVSSDGHIKVKGRGLLLANGEGGAGGITASLPPFKRAPQISNVEASKLIGANWRKTCEGEKST